MNEVEMMYSNAGIKPLCQIPDRYCGMKNIYEDFTAEKQIQLILFILNTFKQGFNCRVEGGKISLDTLARGIAQEVINLWQDLTEEEKQQVKGILE